MSSRGKKKVTQSLAERTRILSFSLRLTDWDIINYACLKCTIWYIHIGICIYACICMHQFMKLFKICNYYKIMYISITPKGLFMPFCYSSQLPFLWIFFFFTVYCVYYKVVYHSLLIYSSRDGDLGCFHFFSISNKISMKKFTHRKSL